MRAGVSKGEFYGERGRGEIRGRERVKGSGGSGMGEGRNGYGNGVKGGRMKGLLDERGTETSRIS